MSRPSTRPMEAEYLTMIDPQRHVIDGGKIAEFARQVFRLDCVWRVHNFLPRTRTKNREPRIEDRGLRRAIFHLPSSATCDLRPAVATSITFHVSHPAPRVADA